MPTMSDGHNQFDTDDLVKGIVGVVFVLMVCFWYWNDKAIFSVSNFLFAGGVILLIVILSIRGFRPRNRKMPENHIAQHAPEQQLIREEPHASISSYLSGKGLSQKHHSCLENAIVGIFGFSLLVIGIFFWSRTPDGSFFFFGSRCKQVGGIAEHRDGRSQFGMALSWPNVCISKQALSDVGTVCKVDKDCLGTCERDTRSPGYEDDVLQPSDIYRCTNVLFYQE